MGLAAEYAKKIIGSIKCNGAEKINRPAFLAGRLGRVDTSTPIGLVRYVVLDTELTGLKPQKDSIVSIGAVEMMGGKIEIGRTYYRVVEPRTAMGGESVVIHGITPSDAAQCPDIETLLPEFIDFCGNAVLVGHVVSIDMAFINREMKRIYRTTMPNQVVDTLSIYRWLSRRDGDVCPFYVEGDADVRLSALAEILGIPYVHAHNAQMDAYITAQIFQIFLSRLPRLGINTLDDLLRIGKT